MKASREETFRPVTLILETQEEVDALFSFLNNNKLTSSVGLDYESYEALEPFANYQAVDALSNKLQKVLK